MGSYKTVQWYSYIILLGKLALNCMIVQFPLKKEESLPQKFSRRDNPYQKFEGLIMVVHTKTSKNMQIPLSFYKSLPKFFIERDSPFQISKASANPAIPPCHCALK